MSGHSRTHGTVYLAGTGSGDVELLTLKTARLLASADVIFYDRLVNPLVLFLAKPSCQFVYCGKEPNHHHLTQAEINHRLIQEAKSGKEVLRLKGGDPVIFGRVGEEMRELDNADILYEVIPGITAASAASSYAGISLTERNISQQVTLATGHFQAENEEIHRDFASLVTQGTLVYYMAVKNLPIISDRLLTQGISPELPVAAIMWGSYGRQRTIVTNLANLLNLSQTEKIINPALIIFGEVVKLRKKTAWFEQLPDFGRKLLLVSDSKLEWDKIVKYTGRGADVWGLQIGTAHDQRFDEISRRHLIDHDWDEVVFLSETETIQEDLKQELTRLEIPLRVQKKLLIEKSGS